MNPVLEDLKKRLQTEQQTLNTLEDQLIKIITLKTKHIGAAELLIQMIKEQEKAAEKPTETPPPAQQ